MIKKIWFIEFRAWTRGQKKFQFPRVLRYFTGKKEGEIAGIDFVIPFPCRGYNIEKEVMEWRWFMMIDIIWNDED